jgi:hypothetical protein
MSVYPLDFLVRKQARVPRQERSSISISKSLYDGNIEITGTLSGIKYERGFLAYRSE